METKHGMKKLTLGNWREPDKASLAYCGVYEESIRPMDGNDWVTYFMAIELDPTVPGEIERLFETAKAALCYGWFYHSLFTFGMEQMCRVAETAVKVKCREIGLYVERESFFARIKKLAAANVITEAEEAWWHGVRELRNEGSHPGGQMILPPGTSSTLVRNVARQISALFV